MTIYYILFLSFPYFYCLFSKVAYHNNDKLLRACVYAIFVILILALRHPSMGIDLGYTSSYGYLRSYEILSSMSFAEIFNLPQFFHYEKGYIWLNWLLGCISDNYQILLIASALLSIIPVAYLFYKESVSLEISYIIYLSLQSFMICFSGLRQGISVGICMIAFLFVQKHCPKKFLATVLLAASFHTSALLFLIAYPLYYFKIKKEFRWITVLILLISFVLKGPLFVFLSKLFRDNAAIEDTGAITFFIVFSAVYIFCFLFAEDNEKNNGLLNLIFIACFCLAFTGVYSLAMRAGYSFMNMLPLILPRAINGIENKYLKLAFQIVMVTSFVIFALNGLYSTYWAMAYPYSFFWE